ncbi:MAG: TonB-dependent receptor [Rhizomicrobium sp.]|nr:TonB-dependent receptor [Rhizomicrobium sp.]
MAVAMAGPALAQQSAETVVVTGSRIPVSSNLSSVSPVQTVTDEQFKLKGATDVVDLLNDMPQTFVSNTSDFTNANNPLSTPGGVTTVDLRGLGATRTLVLVNGRRLGLGDPNTGNPNAAPDLDQIPTTLVERVEVLTGGASATYGSDAVAGVVNFQMKQDFEGVQVDFQWGADWHDNTNSFARSVEQKAITANTQGPLSLAKDSAFDGQNLDASIIMGVNTAGGKGNVTAYLSYRNADPVWMKNRDFSACQINIVDGGQATKLAGSNCSGSSNSNNVNGFSVVGSSLVPRPSPGSSPPSSFNSNTYESLSRQDTRFNGGFFAHYDLADYAKPYSEFSFMDDRSYQQIAPGAVFAGANALSADGSGLWVTNCDNPLLSAQEKGVLCSPADVAAGNDTEMDLRRRNIEGGPRYSQYEHESFRGVVGVKGDFADAWHYDVFGSYYYVTGTQFNGNYLSNRRINNALEVVNVGGVPTCKSVVNGSDTSCVPYNIWTQGGVTKAQTDYLASFGTSQGNLFEEILEADLTGDLGAYGVKSPFSSDGVSVSVGLTNRKDKMYFQGDQAESSNDLVGFSGATVSVNNAVNVTEEYGEFRIPLAQNQPFIQDLSIEAGIRFSSYTNGTHPTTWKSGVQWAPVSDIRFRASYDVAIRAPSILESFTPESVTNTSVVSEDPCAPSDTTHVASATLAQCMRTGVTAAQYGNGGSTNTITQCPSGQCAVLQGGNPDLKPEKAKTFSVGLTATPTIVPGLVASMDYYKIDVYNEVGTIPIDVSLANCLSTGDPRFCNNIKRTSVGTLYGTTINGGGYLIGNNLNIGFGNISGIDFQADYQTSLDDLGLDGFGALAFHLTGSYTLTAKTQTTPDQPVYDCVGLFGNTCGGPLPSWRHNFRVNWETPWDVLVAVTWRYIGSSALDSNTSNPVLSNGKTDRFNAGIGVYNYFDVAATWQMTKELELRAGMANIFDTDPPIISNLITGTGTPNTYNSYDVLGRSVFVSLTAKL